MSGWSHYRVHVGAVPEHERRRAAERLEQRLDALAHRGRGWVAAAIVAAAAALVLAGWLAWPGAPRSTSVVIATAGEAREIELPDGGRLWIEASSRVELVLDDHGAVVELHDGAVELAVHARPGARWRVQMHGYAVEAVGTRFRVRHTDGVPEVTVAEGTVSVHGPDLPAQGLRVSATAPSDAPMHVASGGDRPPTITAAPAPETRDAVNVAPRSTVVRRDTTTSVDSQRRAPTSAPGKAIHDDGSAPSPIAAGWIAEFRTDIAAGDLRAATKRLPSSFPDDGSSLRADDYLDAGDALAAAGDAQRAESSYRAACRARPRATACGVASFRRALAHARADELAQAIELADDYLAHDPDGALARDAVGRRMEWGHALGRRDAARRDAELYLARWPEGARADAARGVLAR